MEIEVILFFGLTGFYAYFKSIEMVGNKKEGPVQVLIAYYGMLAIPIAIFGVISELFL